MKKERRKLIKFSNYSLCVTLPKWVVKDLGWEKGEIVDMSVDAKKGTILISKDSANQTEQQAETPLVEDEIKTETRW